MAHRFSRAQRLFAVVVAAVLLGGLAGCQSNPDPAPLPPAPSSSAAKPTPSAAAPTMPSEANGTGAKAAKAFVRHYVELINYAGASGDVEPLRAASSPNCASCLSVQQRIEQVYQAGGHIKSRGWRVTALAVSPGPSSHSLNVDAAIALSPQTVVKKNGAQSKHFRGGKLPLTFHLRSVNGTWVVDQWERGA